MIAEYLKLFFGFLAALGAFLLGKSRQQIEELERENLRKKEELESQKALVENLKYQKEINETNSKLTLNELVDKL